MSGERDATSQGLSESEAHLSKILSEALQGKTSLGIELGLGAEELEALYVVGYNLYSAGKYADAMRMFSVLCLLAPTEYRYIFGAASCFQMVGEFLMASIYFQLAGGLNLDDPAPMMHTAECLLSLKDKDGARFALEQAISRAGDQPQYGAFKQKAEVILENLTA